MKAIDYLNGTINYRDLNTYLAENGCDDDEYGVTVNYVASVDTDTIDYNEDNEYGIPDELISLINRLTPYDFDSVEEFDNICLLRLRLKDEYIKKNAEEFVERIIDYNEGIVWYGEDEMYELTWSVNEHSDTEYNEYIIKALADKGWEYTGRNYFNAKWDYYFKKVA